MNVDLKKFKEEQLGLSKKLILTDYFDKVKTIAGVDQAFFDDKIISAIVVCDAKTMEIKEEKYAVKKIEVPYISGYLAFREGSVIAEAYYKLKEKPDILIFDGNGILHPLKIGLASHMGILLDQVSIGVAKSLLTGKVVDELVYVKGEIRGRVIKTKEKTKDIYVSQGYKISLKSAVEIVQSCMKEHKLPEPLHFAHKYANKLKRLKSGK